MAFSPQQPQETKVPTESVGTCTQRVQSDLFQPGLRSQTIVSDLLCGHKVCKIQREAQRLHHSIEVSEGSS